MAEKLEDSHVYFNSVTVDDSNTYLTTGYEVSSAGANTEAVLVKFDTDGNILWQKK